MQHRYIDISYYSTPYKGGVFDRAFLSGLGQEATAPEQTPTGPAPSEEPAPAPVEIAPVTVYGHCDFTTGERVAAVQAYLAAEGVLSAGELAEEAGTFGDATCAAWKKKFGSTPTLADLEKSTLGPDAVCATSTLPECAKAGVLAALTPQRMLFIGGGLALLYVVARSMRKR